MHKDIKEILYTEEEIKAKCDELAKQIDQDYAGQEILLVGLLKGSVPFMAELAKHLKSDVKFDFMSVSSYSGVESKTLVVRQDIKEDITGCTKIQEGNFIFKVTYFLVNMNKEIIFNNEKEKMTGFPRY